MSSGITHELSRGIIIDSDDSHESASSEKFATLLDVNGQQLVSFSWIWSWIKGSLGLWLSDVPVSNFPILSYTKVLVAVNWGHWKAINSSHSQCLIGNSLLVLEVPAQNGFVSGGSQQVNVICKDLNLCDLACVLLQMRYELSRSDFPDSNLSFMAAGDNKFIVVAQSDCCHTILVSIIDLP